MIGSDNTILVVKDDPSLVRDPYSKAIINRNTNDYLRRLATKCSADAKQAELEKLKSEVQDLKVMVQTLSNLLSVK